MLFNSFEFTLFLPIVFCLYWAIFCKDIAARNIFLIVVSYVFYGFWDWRFLLLIAFSSTADYLIGRRMGKEENEDRRKRLLYLSLFVNLGLLCVFKYFGFFAESFADFANLFGWQVNSLTMNVILPVGISFYTFQTLSYTIDVYRKQLEPTEDIFAFFAFVSFFPQLVAGPIERAKNLIPQFLQTVSFSYKQAVDGMRQILWGFFKKVVIADGCAKIVNPIFESYHSYSSLALCMGAIFFAIQIYCDFSGYSDIAIGTAKLFGFTLMKNFDTPYFSTSTTTLWQKWHISLGSWVNDYLHKRVMPKLYRKFNRRGIVYSLILTFGVIGIWHGPNYTYLIFGLLHGIVVGAEFLLTYRRRKWRNSIGTLLYNILGWIFTMLFWLATLILFRSSSINEAYEYLYLIWASPVANLNLAISWLLLMGIVFLFVAEWYTRKHPHPLYVLKNKPMVYNYSIYIFLCLFILIGGVFEKTEFIYFQF